jgi:hypothetical protein
MVKSISAWRVTVRPTYWTALKVSLMLSALFWTVIYRLSESVARVPDFVYVNF